MPTTRQRKLAKVIVENLQVDKPLNAGQMLEKVGYAKSVADAKSKDILSSEGVKESLSAFGFNEERAKEVVAEILVAGENDTVKLKAAEMIFKVHGTFAAEKHVNLNINETHDSRLDALVAQIEAQLDEPEGTTISP